MLYHKDLGFPKSLKLPRSTTFILEYTQHALRAADNDRYGKIILPRHILITQNIIIEVETEDNLIPIKIVTRTKYSEQYDLCMAILIKDEKVKTVWLNNNKDLHTTLDKNKYTKL